MVRKRGMTRVAIAFIATAMLAACGGSASGSSDSTVPVVEVVIQIIQPALRIHFLVSLSRIRLRLHEWPLHAKSIIIQTHVHRAA